jgi:hypothetical protein
MWELRLSGLGRAAEVWAVAGARSAARPQSGRRAVQVFDNLLLPNVPGRPRLAYAAGDWFRDIVRAAFGSLDKGHRRAPRPSFNLRAACAMAASPRACDCCRCCLSSRRRCRPTSSGLARPEELTDGAAQSGPLNHRRAAQVGLSRRSGKGLARSACTTMFSIALPISWHASPGRCWPRTYRAQSQVTQI